MTCSIFVMKYNTEYSGMEHLHWLFLFSTILTVFNYICCHQLYDLANPGLFKNSMAGCPQTEDVCNTQESTFRCWEHGMCVGSFSEARCQCKPGWTGPGCITPTVPTTFKPQSYVKYALSFEPDRFSTHMQLRFRTREEHGELFRVSDQHNREYGILEVRNLKKDK